MIPVSRRILDGGCTPQSREGPTLLELNNTGRAAVSDDSDSEFEI